jgi:4'-phosphopantetheinyl transferase
MILRGHYKHRRQLTMSKTFKTAKLAETQPKVGLAWPELTEPPDLSANSAHLWAISLNADVEPPVASAECLSDDERRRAQQFRFDAPRRRFIAARVALRQLLGQYLDLPAANISLAYNRFGKPLLGEPHADLLRFNLAHTSDLALVGVTRGCDVGVDIERLRAVNRLESIARRYLHPAEAAGILAADVELRHEAFLRCWTAKEAVIKAAGTGLTDSLGALCVPVADTRGAWIELPACGDNDTKQCWLLHFTPCESAIGAVAFVGGQRGVSCFTLKDRDP